MRGFCNRAFRLPRAIFKNKPAELPLLEFGQQVRTFENSPAIYAWAIDL